MTDVNEEALAIFSSGCVIILKTRNIIRFWPM